MEQPMETPDTQCEATTDLDGVEVRCMVHGLKADGTHKGQHEHTSIHGSVRW